MKKRDTHQMALRLNLIKCILLPFSFSSPTDVTIKRHCVYVPVCCELFKLFQRIKFFHWNFFFYTYNQLLSHPFYLQQFASEDEVNKSGEAGNLKKKKKKTYAHKELFNRQATTIKIQLYFARLWKWNMVI